MTVFVSLLYIAGHLSTAIYPVYVTSFLAGGYATTSNVGVLATAEFLPFGLSIMFSGRVLPERHLRATTGVCLSVQMLLAYATTRLPFLALIPCRALYGIASGTLIWIAYSYIARFAHAARLVGTYCTVLITLSILWSWGAPAAILPAYGPPGVILLMALPSLVAVLLLALAPDEFAPLPLNVDERGGTVKTTTLSAASLLVLCSVGMWSAFEVIIWVYSEPLARRYTGTLIQHWLTVSLFFQMAGAASSAFLAERLPYQATISGGLVALFAQASVYYLGASSLAFVLWSGVSGFFGYFLYPCYVRALSETDSTRRSVVYFPAAANLAGSLGPLIVSGFVSDTDLNAGLLISLGASSSALVLFWIALAIHRRQRARKVTSVPAS